MIIHRARGQLTVFDQRPRLADAKQTLQHPAGKSPDRIEHVESDSLTNPRILLAYREIPQIRDPRLEI